MAVRKPQQLTTESYVGTLVGESTSREFRLAVAHEALREQDIIAVDAELHRPDDGSLEAIRVWAKVQRIERINPLFPSEAGHELAATRTNPLDTVLSLSREMVTAVCMVLGSEPLDGKAGKLDHLRYPAQPASTAYRPATQDVARIVLGDLAQRGNRSLDIATLANRTDVDVCADGHAIVTRHLAILAMTGAGKSWAARRIIEQLAAKNYPILIFDPHGDYTGLDEVEGLGDRVQRYYAQFPIFEQGSQTAVSIIESLGWEMAKTHRAHFDALFEGARSFIGSDSGPHEERTEWLADYIGNSKVAEFGLGADLYALADLTQAVIKAGRQQDTHAQGTIVDWTRQDGLKVNKQTAGWMDGLPMNLRTAAKRLRQMEHISRTVAQTTTPLPLDRTRLVQYGKIGVVALAGYPTEFQSMIYSLIAESIFEARVSGELALPVLMLLEEAHNFAPAHAVTTAEQRSITITKQIAQEGRKFRVGLILISQRPSRLDETTLSQCNSFVIMRMVNPADQNYVRKVIESLGEDEARMLPDLDVGEAILSGQFTNLPVLVKIKPPQSKGEREETDAFEELERIAHAGTA